jgi:hypothetical protein
MEKRIWVTSQTEGAVGTRMPVKSRTEGHMKSRTRGYHTTESV